MTTLAPSSTRPVLSAPPQPDPAERQRRREQARRWLDALPTRTFVRRRSPAHPHARLVMYRTSAASPEYWENLWLVNPSYRMRGYRLPAWYGEVFTRVLPSDGLIVEAGCGNGNLVRMLINQDPERWGGAGDGGGGGATVEGLDFAEHAIAENRRVHPEGRYRVGDVRALPYADRSIAAYLSMGVIEHFDESARAVILREAERVLRPGGIAIFTVPHFNLARRIRAALGGYPRESSDASPPSGDKGLEFYQFYFRAPEIRAQVEAAGLRVVEIDGYDARHGFIETWGGRGVISAVERRIPRMSGLIEQPPRPVRLALGHMLLLVARKH